MADGNLLLDVFIDRLQEAKEANLRQLDSLFAMTTAKLTTEIDGDDPAVREERRQEAIQQLQDAVADAMGANSDQPRSHLAMRAISMQGDFMDSRHRAEVARHSSFARRAVHAKTRRESHSREGGYFDRRVETPVVATIQRIG